MHELSIAAAVLDAVRAAAKQRPDVRVRRVGLRIGEFGGVDGDALTFCFEAITRDTELDGVALDIETCAGGDQLDLAFVEVDDGAAAP